MQNARFQVGIAFNSADECQKCENDKLIYMWQFEPYGYRLKFTIYFAYIDKPTHQGRHEN
jgi:hypothetical protein